MKSEAKFEPIEVSDVDVAFPSQVRHLLPPGGEAPTPKGSQAAATWFYSGAEGLDLRAKEGINARRALRHISCILGSYELKHEVKMHAVAVLLDMWFTWGPRGQGNS